MLPLEINYHMNIDQLYDSGEALQVLKLSKKNSKYSIKLRKLIYGGYNILSSSGVSELSFALYDIADSTMSAAIYICEPYTMFLFFNQWNTIFSRHISGHWRCWRKIYRVSLSIERINLHGLLQTIVVKLVLSNSKTHYQSMFVIDLVEKEISEDG